MSVLRRRKSSSEAVEVETLSSVLEIGESSLVMWTFSASFEVKLRTVSVLEQELAVALSVELRTGFVREFGTGESSLVVRNTLVSFDWVKL